MADAFCLSTPIPIPMFNGDKYDVWSIKMKTYLRAHKLWDVVSNGYTVPDGSSTLTVAEHKKLLEENQQRDNYALLAIQTSLTEEYFPRIERAETSKAAWDILKEDFQDNHNHKMSSTDEYVLRIETAETSKPAWDILKDDFQDNHKKHFFLAPDPFAAKMEFNVGTNSSVNGKKHKSKNKKHEKERQKAAAVRGYTPPGSEIISGLARESELKDDSSSSKKRKASNLNSEENMERGQKMKKRLFDDHKKP